MANKKDLSNWIFLLAGLIIVSLLVLGRFGGVLSVSAMTNEDTTDSMSDSRDWMYIQDSLSLWDKFRLGFSDDAFTVVGGATCSPIPDKQKTYTASASKICHTNNDHIGDVFQMFKVTDTDPYTTSYMGSREILKGDKQCFNTVIGQKYHYDIYYCDNLILDKTCTDTDDLDYFNKGTVTFSTNPYNPQEFDDYCSSTTKLNERYCDIDDSVQTQVYTCADKCVDGACVVVTPTTKDITCYPLLANCVAKTFTVGLSDDCSDVRYNGYDVSSYGSQSDCIAIQNPPVPPSPPTTDCDDWRFIECDGDDAKVTCFDPGSARYGDSRTESSDHCSGDDLTDTCNEWNFMGCSGTMAKEQCFDTDSKLYGNTRTVASADCVEDDPILTDDCKDWVIVGCEGIQGKEYCFDSLSKLYQTTQLVSNDKCAEGVPPTEDFNLMDWIENNVVMVGGAMIGMIMLFTLLVVGVILMSKKK